MFLESLNPLGTMCAVGMIPMTLTRAIVVLGCCTLSSQVVTGLGLDPLGN